MHDFDLSLDMDLLGVNRVQIDCFTKTVTIQGECGNIE